MHGLQHSLHLQIGKFRIRLSSEIRVIFKITNHPVVYAVSAVSVDIAEGCIIW